VLLVLTVAGVRRVVSVAFVLRELVVRFGLCVALVHYVVRVQ